MRILDRIKQWFSGKKPVNNPVSPAGGSVQNNSTASKMGTAPADRPIPSTATTKYSATSTIPAAMLNTITLSSSQDRLFLIDDGRLIAFSLDKRGVSIGLLDGQLAVITPNKPTEENEEADDKPDENEGTAPPIARAAQKKTKTVSLPLRKNAQYTLTYNAANQAMGIIGATDIISTITVPDHPGDSPSGNCQLHLFDLSENILTLQRTKDSLLLTLKARK